MATGRSECSIKWFYEENKKTNYKILGSSLSMLSNRISFWLNTKGSSFTITGEEVAGASVLQMAVDLIKNGHCDDVITGAVNIIDHPGISASYRTLGTLSSDGECRAFDADGTGYGRSEACVVLYLQKAKYAKRVYSTVVHAQSLFCGHRNAGLVRPVSDNILELLERFYEKTGVDPAQVCYLESSANGIKEYEQSEFEAVSKVLLRNRRYPLLTGSVKSNMGNASAASLFCSVIKLLIAMQRGVIPANLHFNTPGLHIPGLAEGNIKVVTENTKWNPDLSAVNTLDCAGNFGHVLLRPYKKGGDKFNYGNELPRLVCMSGRSEEGTQKNLQKVKNMELNIEFIRLVQDVYSKPFLRNHYRGYMITSPTCEQVVVEVCANLSEQPTWDFRLERALLEIIDNSITRKRHMSFALDSIYREICNIHSYMPGRELLSGNVTLFRPKILTSDDTCGLGKFFKKRANVVVVEADYSSLLKNTKIADVISDLSLVNLYWKKDQSC